MPLQCLFGMYGTELLFHQRLLQEAAACNTTPEEAELFFVPSYFKCIEAPWLGWIQLMLGPAVPIYPFLVGRVP